MKASIKKEQQDNGKEVAEKEKGNEIAKKW
jgi:hypothetical protein